MTSPSLAFSGEGCVLSILEKLRNSEPPSIASRLDKVGNQHVREAPEGGFEVLLPQSDGTFMIQKTAKLPEAQLLAAKIQKPINLDALILQGRNAFDELAEGFRQVKATEPSTEFAARLKTVDSLKTKIFERVREKGFGFRLSDLDDAAGARFTTSDKAQIARVAEAVKKMDGVTVLLDETKNYDRGYRARHLALRTPKGNVVEVQVMSRRTAFWAYWNHDRVYKPATKPTPEYLGRLKKYDLAIIQYLNTLDDGIKSPLPPPRSELYGIFPEDQFPPTWLR